MVSSAEVAAKEDSELLWEEDALDCGDMDLVNARTTGGLATRPNSVV